MSSSGYGGTPAHRGVLCDKNNWQISPSTLSDSVCFHDGRTRETIDKTGQRNNPRNSYSVERYPGSTTRNVKSASGVV